ncbi:ecotin family protein [Phocoenobacter atlanticus]|uniref:ecotin family protein n=1 Tax=Phocoenobacter atlanticus TaxID=3416742 RepID=UPI0027678AF3|nr:ecotin family protein [Pasteurella atlantica]MDP8100662.1 ecotin family protein [Pasteurella atlantica]
MKKIMAFIVLGISGCGVSQPNNLDISMYPKAEKNQIQHTITLEPLKNEENYKVELFLAKEMMLDCNYHSLPATFVKKDVKGWGYFYYQVATDGNIRSTMMACPESKAKKGEVLSQGFLQNYNSKLPLVIYSPKGYSVKYRVWSTTVDKKNATKIEK